MEEPAIEIIKSKIVRAAKTNLNSYYDDPILIKSFRGLGIWLRKKYIRHDCYPIFQRQIFKWKVNLYLLRNDPAHAFHELDQFVRLYNILLVTLPPVLKNAHTITDVHKFDIAKANLHPHGILSKIHLRLSDKHNTPEDYSSLMKSLALHKDDQWLKDQNTLSSVTNFIDPTTTAAGKSVFAFQANTKQSFFNRSRFPYNSRGRGRGRGRGRFNNRYSSPKRNQAHYWFNNKYNRIQNRNFLYPRFSHNNCPNNRNDIALVG